MKLNWHTIREVIRVDLLTMRGGKKNGALVAVLIFLVFCLAAGFMISPVASLYLPFILGGFFVPTLFHNEMKYHSEKMWSLLPIQRRDLVNARFLLSYGLYAAVSLVVYLLMLLSMRLELWYRVTDENMIDIISLVAKGMGMSKMGFFNMVYFAAVTAGMIFMGSTLRTYFRDPEALRTQMNLGAKGKSRIGSKKEITAAAVILGLFIVGALAVTGILPIIPAIRPVTYVFRQLAGAADGVIFGVILLTVAVFQVMVYYIGTLIDYDKREL
ncbi:MAG: ABC-2 transporter permease [Oscillospiraceae bacterium]|nr:ABC-2 transporter permease [Oscillospiraceae bacterium]